MKTITIILIGLICLSLIAGIYYINNQQNVYEYLSDGKYSKQLTAEQSKLESEKEFWRAEEINAKNKQGEIEVQLLNLNEGLNKNVCLV